jgi:hypothetical protein
LEKEEIYRDQSAVHLKWLFLKIAWANFPIIAETTKGISLF